MPDADPGGKPPPLLSENAQRLLRELMAEVGPLLNGGPPTEPKRSTRPPDLVLTAHQLDLLRWICYPDDYSYEYIALQMGLTIGGVHDLRHRLFEKLKVHSKAQAARRAVEWGLLVAS